MSEVPDGNGTIRDLPENTSYSDLVAEKPENYFIYDADSGFIGKDVDTPLLNKQSDIFEWLSGINSELEFLFAKDPGKIIDFYSKDSSENTVCQVKDRGKKFRELLHKYNLVRETSIKGVHHTRISHDFVYGRTSDMYGKEYVSNGEGRFGAVNVTENEYRCIVLPSNSKSDRRGEQVVFVKPELARVLGSHALIVFRAGYTETGRHFIVKISADSTIENDAIAHLDQKVRHAIGVHSGEAVSLFPISSNGFLSSFVENFKNLMPTRYLPVRVSYADLLNAESDVALADPRILSYLGLGNGDILVLEGVVEGRIRRLKLRIAEADARFLEERLRLSKGSVSARFSCPDTVLRVYPDLPPIFIDELTRNLLGVCECPLMPLRVRPSRRQKILFELRELMLVLAISLIGLVSLSDSLIISAASLGFITVVAIVISLARVRSQIGILKRRRP
ncbi:hypothetical protein [Arcanobacterium hippocoleae]|uniref:hypothetical protein n=1 Tax=Arcanobacterium hippocoleae TaxID=149017 RepID=UPI0033419510